jgi:hypothetical protein
VTAKRTTTKKAATKKKVAAKPAKRRPTQPRSPFVYMTDMTEALGVTRMTIRKYVQMQLLPAPVMVSDGKQGVRSRWTPIALDHAAYILEQQEVGHTLAEIAGMIAARWGRLRSPQNPALAGPRDSPACGSRRG